MEWILLLLCPLMMLFCMKGMFTSGKKDCHGSKEMADLKKQLNVMKEQNRSLIEQVNHLNKKSME
jgi:Protein of unknown function (DUF2933)